MAGRALGLLASVLLAGCTFDEAVPRLGVTTPARFAGGAREAAPPLPANWASLFRDPALTTLAALAGSGNFDVAVAAARIVQAQGQAEIASANQLPLLSGSGVAQRSYLSAGSSGVTSVSTSTGGTSTTGTTGTSTGATAGTTTTTGSTSAGGTTVLASRGGATNLFRLGLTASYEVDLWGRNAYDSLAAEHTVVATRFARDTLVLSSVAAVVNQYFLLLSAQDRIRIAQRNARAAREVLDAIDLRLSVGTVTQLEVAQQRSVVAQQLAVVPPLQLQADQARNQIALLTGRTPESVRVPGGSLDKVHAPLIASGLPSGLLRRRPDVVQAEENLASADSTVQASRAAFFPSLTLTGSGGLESTALKNLLNPAALFGTLAAGVAQPIFDGYALQGQLDQARGLRREYLETYRKSIVQALVDVENALAAVRLDLQHERLLADVVRASQEAYDIERERLKVGTIDITTVLQTQLTLFGAQDALAVARLTRYQALASLAQALGGGWTDPRRGPVQPAIAFPAPFTTGLPGRAIVPPNEAVTETHALEGQPPVPNGGTLFRPGLGPTRSDGRL